jgi:hypothetical protein
MDLLVFDGVDLVGIEAKLSDWRRALAQAVLNRYCVDRSYVALWASKVSPEVVEAAMSFGVGVLSVNDERVDVSHEAPRSSPTGALRQRLLQTPFEEETL